MNCRFAGFITSGHDLPGKNTLQQMLHFSDVHRTEIFDYWAEPQLGLGHSYQRKGNEVKDGTESIHVTSDSNRSYFVVFNGNIVNRKTLINDLFSENASPPLSDPELLVHLYERFGADCVLRMQGMFAFVLWDPVKKHLFGARDRFGIKPFYYALNRRSDTFLFASSIRSILQSGLIESGVEEEAFFHYFTFQYVPDPATMFSDIHSLFPGHRIIVQCDGNIQLQIERYFEPQFVPGERPFSDVVEQLRETLKAAVRSHLEDGEVGGSFLSSGIDSTAIAALMREFGPNRTFSVGFSGAQNETVIAEQTAKALGTEHVAQLIHEQDYFDSLPHVIRSQEEPVADPSAVALYHVAKLASSYVGAVLSGEGADELFGGYLIYREPQALRPLQMLPKPMQEWLHALAKKLPSHVKGRGYILRGTTPLERRYLGNARIFSDEMKAELIARNGNFANGSFPEPYQITDPLYERTMGWDDVSRMQYIDLNVWMPGNIMAKAEKMTRAHGIEVRSPFLDYAVFELASQIPATYRIAKGTTKYVLRKAMEGIVPDFVLHRPKLGFPVPLRQWLKGKSGMRLFEQITSGKAQYYFNLPYVEKLLKAHREGQADYSRHLWTIFIFAMWHQQFVEASHIQAIPDREF